MLGAPGCQDPQIGLIRLAVLDLGEHLEQRPAEDFVRRLVPQVQRRAVGEQDALVAVDREHRLADRLQHLGEPPLGGAHGLARLAPDARHREMQPDPRQQLARAERLRQIVVGAGFERLAPGAFVGFGRQQDDGKCVRCRMGPQPAQQRISVPRRQRGIGDDEIRRIMDRGKGGAPVGQFFDLASGPEQDAVQPLADRRIGVADQDARRVAVRGADQRPDIGAARQHLGQNLR